MADCFECPCFEIYHVHNYDDQDQQYSSPLNVRVICCVGNIDTAMKTLEGWGPVNPVFSEEAAGDQAVRTYSIYSTLQRLTV